MSLPLGLTLDAMSSRSFFLMVIHIVLGVLAVLCFSLAFLKTFFLCFSCQDVFSAFSLSNRSSQSSYYFLIFFNLMNTVWFVLLYNSWLDITLGHLMFSIFLNVFLCNTSISFFLVLFFFSFFVVVRVHSSFSCYVMIAIYVIKYICR